jgi:flagellum-specific peptidoglycan hydrolase FlgJ
MKTLFDPEIAPFQLRPEFEAALDSTQLATCPHCRRDAAARFETAGGRHGEQPAGPAPGPSTACPKITRRTIGRFPRYQKASKSLPLSEQAKLRQIASTIVHSHRPGCPPIRAVLLIGHADHDPEREQQEPGFIAKISTHRALAVQHALIHLIGDAALVSGIRWIHRGVGDRFPVVPDPQTEADRARNRRVDVIFDPRSPAPPHTEPQPRPQPPQPRPAPYQPQPPSQPRPQPPQPRPAPYQPQPPSQPRPQPPQTRPAPYQPQPQPPAGSFPPAVIAAAVASHHRWRVPASVTLAQWAVESAFGKAMPIGSNNPFGIKAGKGQPFVEAHTREVISGKDVTIVAKFRKFDSITQAFDKHGRLLATNRPYTRAMSLADNPDGFADALTGVYATDPRYGTVLRSIMNKYNLYQYDKA